MRWHHPKSRSSPPPCALQQSRRRYRVFERGASCAHARRAVRSRAGQDDADRDDQRRLCAAGVHRRRIYRWHRAPGRQCADHQLQADARRRGRSRCGRGVRLYRCGAARSGRQGRALGAGAECHRPRNVGRRKILCRLIADQLERHAAGTAAERGRRIGASRARGRETAGTPAHRRASEKSHGDPGPCGKRADLYPLRVRGAERDRSIGRSRQGPAGAEIRFAADVRPRRCSGGVADDGARNLQRIGPGFLADPFHSRRQCRYAHVPRRVGLRRRRGQSAGRRQCRR